MTAAAIAPVVFGLSIPIAVTDAELGAISWLAMVPAALATRWWFERARRGDVKRTAAQAADRQ